MLARMAGALQAARAPVRWATDIRGEGSLDARRARDLAAGGALAVSVGLESASPRVLSLIDKGLDVATMRSAVRALAEAGIAVEVMVFTGFPTESAAEALETIGFLRDNASSIALFMCGEFVLTPGSRVAADPRRYGIGELWTLKGDETGLGLFYEPEREWKTEAQRRRVDAALEAVAAGWSMSSYPWAGSLSTAHTLLWYRRHGPGVFRGPAGGEPCAAAGAARRGGAMRRRVWRRRRSSAKRGSGTPSLARAARCRGRPTAGWRRRGSRPAPGGRMAGAAPAVSRGATSATAAAG